MRGRSFDGFFFPLMWNTDRVLIVGAAQFLNVERRLRERFGSAGEAIMFEEGRTYGSETMKHYQDTLKIITIENLLENVKDGLRATGWGIFEFKRNAHGYEVVAYDPPCLNDERQSNRFFCGMIAGILEFVYGVPLRVIDTVIDSEAHKVLVFLEREY